MILAFLDYFATGPDAGAPNLGPVVFYASVVVRPRSWRQAGQMVTLRKVVKIAKR